MDFDNTRVKIDLDAISDNIDAIREKAGVPVMAVIKADAYGRGAVQVARLLQDKCAFFCVSSILRGLLSLPAKCCVLNVALSAPGSTARRSVKRKAARRRAAADEK